MIAASPQKKEMVMTEAANTIDAVCKVALALRAGADEASARAAEPEELEFVYGIGSQGLTGVEYALAGKAAGEKVELWVEACEAHEALGHLPLPAFQWFPAWPKAFLCLEILSVAAPEPREIVRAMAQAQSSSEGGCGCGCSCG